MALEREGGSLDQIRGLKFAKLAHANYFLSSGIDEASSNLNYRSAIRAQKLIDSFNAAFFGTSIQSRDH